MCWVIELLAWAYYLAGRHDEAKSQIRSALRLGTQDAQLQYLAARILDEPDRVRAARKINSQFEKSAPARALPAARP